MQPEHVVLCEVTQIRLVLQNARIFGRRFQLGTTTGNISAKTSLIHRFACAPVRLCGVMVVWLIGSWSFRLFEK